MSFDKVAAAASAQAAILHRAAPNAAADFEDLSRIAAALSGKTLKSAQKVMTIAAQTARAGSPNVRKPAEAAAHLAEMAAALNAPAALSKSLQLLSESLSANGYLSTASFIERLRNAAASEKPRKSSLTATQRAELVAAAAREFETAAWTGDAQAAVLESLKKRRPAVPAEVWIGIARRLYGDEGEIGAPAAKRMLTRRVESAARAEHAKQSVSKAMAAGY